MQRTISVTTEKKLENSSRRKIGKSTDLWELKNTTHLKAN